MARILAKMVNCEHGPTPEPCDACAHCLAIREGRHLDVVEIDAASHGGVEDARELRERAPTAPAMGREKVYIIDEAQRLSAPAFDALLKLFEEPPVGVRFVLATTEPQKMPATIVGRCQRFDFRRLTSDQLGEHLLRIAKDEGVTLTTSAARAVARQAEGSARDALSLLDQASVLGDGDVDDTVIASLLGAPRIDVQYELAEVVAAGDVLASFEVVNRLVMDGQDLRSVTAQTLAHFRDLLLVQTAPGQPELLDVPADEYEHLRAQAEKFTSAELARVIALLLAAQNDMRWTTSPRLSLELALVRSTMPETDPQPAGLLARLERLERLAGVEPTEAEKPGAATTSETSEPSPPPRKAEKETTPAPAWGDPATSGGRADPEERKAGAPPVTAETPSGESTVGVGNVDVAMLRRSWPSLLDRLQSSRQMILRASLESATVASFEGGTLELAFPPDRTFTVKKVEAKTEDLRAVLGEMFGIRPEISCVVREGGAGVAIVEEDDVPSDDEALRRVQEMLGARVAADPDPSG